MAELSESTLKMWKPHLFYCSFWPMLDGRYLTFFWQILYNLLSCFCQLAILVFPFFFFNSALINICVLHSIFKEFIEFVRIDTVRYYWPVRWESCWALATSQRVRQSLGLLSSHLGFFITPTSSGFPRLTAWEHCSLSCPNWKYWY